ncbi:hypothetical protein FE257_005839 [Aspergillus nanangensis]|uniref:FAD-binding domain-containing protein n=1 Tax=Aspergillus nanangensis TaxID=2582783 RepID=A0AAD4CPQ1_ASPNN|nr:hypothetical protein FE257_005839 [Aspergillus nanangensis]
MQHLGLSSRIQDKGNRVEFLDILRYKDGRRLTRRPLGANEMTQLGGEWMVIHRADYHRVLVQEAKRRGVHLRLSSRVESLDTVNTQALLANGEKVSADVIVGADGLWSQTRSTILDQPSPPYETGDLAYRATFARQSLLALSHPRIQDLVNASAVTLWAGPRGHSVFYPVKNGTLFNLVLLRPDNMPDGTRTMTGSIEEMRNWFEGWDPVLTEIISCIPTVLKWKLLHHEELTVWTKDNITLLGDACHPTLPYQAQGAAMAVEDGTVLGLLLGEYHKHKTVPRKSLHQLLKLYETIRKPRTTLNVKGAVNNRHFYHMDDGPEQVERDTSLLHHNWENGKSKYAWADVQYQKDLLGYDVIAQGRLAFEAWINSGLSGASL